ncbi:hypothetical protein GCM10018966_096250 [Streptomyces yanii]
MSKKTPLHDIHTQLGASFTDFADWSMPLRCTSELAEHHAVRITAGIFDLTHMGEIEVSGPEVGRALDHALVGQPSKIAVGRARYSMLVHETGGVLNDLVVYRLAEQRYLVVANAGNVLVVLSHLRDRIDGYATTIRDVSSEWALIAVQGPTSPAILGAVVDDDVPSLKYYAIDPARLADHDVLLARTGYTGEDGFEIYCHSKDAVAVWQASPQRARSTGWSRAAWPAVTRCVSRAACRCTARNSPSAPPRSKPDWAESWCSGSPAVSSARRP